MARRKGLPWVMVSVEFEDHPKTIALTHRLGPLAALYLVRLWSHFGRWHEDGWAAKTQHIVADLERAMRWDGEPGELVSALVDLGFLDDGDERLSLHGWAEWSGIAALRMEYDRRRKAARKRKVPKAQGSVPQELHRNSEAASPSRSPSPSPCQSPVSASEESDRQHGNDRGARSGNNPALMPFLLDHHWRESLREPLSQHQRSEFDKALSEAAEAVAVFPPLSPEWHQAQRDVRQRIERQFTRTERMKL